MDDDYDDDCDDFDGDGGALDKLQKHGAALGVPLPGTIDDRDDDYNDDDDDYDEYDDDGGALKQLQGATLDV